MTRVAPFFKKHISTVEALLIAAILISLPLSNRALAAQQGDEPKNNPTELEFGIFPVPGLFEGPDNPGPIDRLVAEIAKRANLDFKMVLTPRNRSIRNLNTEKPIIMGLLLGGPKPENIGEGLRTSYPVVFRRDFAFVKVGNPIPKSKDEVKNVTLVQSPTSDVSPIFGDSPSDIKVVETNSDESAVKMVARGRADMWINDETSTLVAIKSVGETNITYDPSSPIKETPARLVFSKAVSQADIDRINEAILTMVIDGTFAKSLPNNFSENYGMFLNPYYVDIKNSR